MAGNIQRKIQSIDNSLYHNGLVKILIEAHLKKKGYNWEDFLIGNHFKEDEREGHSDKTKKTRRKFPSTPKQKSHARETQQDQYFDNETPLIKALETLKQKNVRRKITINQKGKFIERRNKERRRKKASPNY